MRFLVFSALGLCLPLPARAMTIGEINYAIEPRAAIGPIRVGTLCLPHGKLRGEDIRFPMEREAREALAELVQDEALLAEVQEISLQSLHMKLCVPGAPQLMGKAKVEGAARWRWRIKISAFPSVYREYSFDTTLANSGKDPRKSPEALLDSLRKSGALFSKEYLSSHPK